MASIPFVDLRPSQEVLHRQLEVAASVLASGELVLGPNVSAFEEELAHATTTGGTVGVACGTDALALGLRALGVGRGDEVIVPAFGAFATAAAVLDAGATPVLVDVGRDRPLADLDAALDAVGHRTAAVVIVHLFGAVADAPTWIEAFDPLGVPVIEDCAQAQGAVLPDGSPVGSAGRFGAFSFYPTKNLGAAGDGGAVASNDLALLAEVRAWRSHGEREHRGTHHLPARNSRLDEIQAALLRLQLPDLPGAVRRRRELSARYRDHLGAHLPYADHGDGGAPHLSVVQVSDPPAVAAALAAAGIGTGRHYPSALPDQPALAGRAKLAPCGATNARRWAQTCLSLPLRPQLRDADVDHVGQRLLEATRR